MGDLVSGVASGLLNKLATKAYQEISLACGLKGDVEKLRNSMRIINAFLMDAENKQANNHLVAEWLRQLRDAFDDAVDILDKMEYEAKRDEVVKMYGSTCTKVRRFFSCSGNPLTFNIKISHKIRDVKQRIDEKISVGGNLGIVEQGDNGPSLKRNLSGRETASFVPPRVCGRIKEKEELISLLVRPQTPSQSLSQVNNIDVIPIVGIGGLGKTTLAQMAYNDTRVKEHFDTLIWVCVSDDFNVKKLLSKIVKADSKTERGVDLNSSLDALLSLLHEKLHGRKFLLVLDDVWNESPKKWDDLRNHLLRTGSDMKSRGSKIIVTTRSSTVASIMGSGLPIELKPLPKDECWKLFVKCAFQEEEKEAEQYPWLKEIGKDIVRKCKGLPLAITTLGCLLRSKSHDANEWKNVRDSELWEIDQETDGILPSLRLSYNHLSLEVKQCFSYCSHFPEDYDYHVIELIIFWMAHGLLHPASEKEEPEHIGELYVKELVSASLLQIEDVDFDILRYVNVMQLKTIKMHDLVHDLSKSTMEESNKTRTIQCCWPQVSSMEWTSNKLKCLKSLHLQDMKFLLLPDDCFAKMKYLRYLDLHNCDRLEKLPHSTYKLQILQTLVLSGCFNLQELPKDMKNLVSLRNLFLTVRATSLSSMNIGCLQQLQSLSLLECYNLVSLPSAMGHLIALKKLLIIGCAELTNFEDEEEEEKQHVAAHDLNLQIFVINESPKLQALPIWLKRSTKTLQYMGIEDTGLNALPEWLPNLISLDQLHIKDCPDLSSLPENMDQLHSLRYLRISYCPRLNARCEKDTGSDWPKIAHVPCCEIY